MDNKDYEQIEKKNENGCNEEIKDDALKVASGGLGCFDPTDKPPIYPVPPVYEIEKLIKEVEEFN